MSLSDVFFCPLPDDPVQIRLGEARPGIRAHVLSPVSADRLPVSLKEAVQEYDIDRLLIVGDAQFFVDCGGVKP